MDCVLPDGFVGQFFVIMSVIAVYCGLNQERAYAAEKCRLC